MAAAEARAFLQPCLHTLNPCVLNSRRACSGKVPRSVCSAVFSMENACSSVQDEKFSKSSCLAALGMYHCRADGRPQRTFPDLTQKRYTFSLFQSCALAVARAVLGVGFRVDLPGARAHNCALSCYPVGFSREIMNGFSALQGPYWI